MHFKSQYDFIHYLVTTGRLDGYRIYYTEGFTFSTTLEKEESKALLWEMLWNNQAIPELYTHVGWFDFNLNRRKELKCTASIHETEGFDLYIEPLVSWINELLGCSDEIEFYEIYLKYSVPNYEKNTHQLEDFRIINEDGKPVPRTTLKKIKSRLIRRLNEYIVEQHKLDSFDAYDGYDLNIEGDEGSASIALTGHKVYDCQKLKECKFDLEFDFENERIIQFDNLNNNK